VPAVGETIGSTLPFMGEGIGKAMQTGEIAARIIHQAFVAGDMSRLRDYPRRIDVYGPTMAGLRGPER